MPLLEVKNLSKRYQMTYEKQALVRYLLPKFLRIQKFGDFWAIRGVSFQLNKGEVLGVIGPNGAGKSTLLNLCSGITAPTEGEIKVSGKIASLLTLGAGFHNDLTGEENIYLNGAILGLTIKEIRRKMDGIIRFSELGSLIEAPLQTYSAGMMMRLGFAIAIHAPFDILVIDEIMAVGDTAFQKKCFAKLGEFRKLGKSLILATHGLDTVESFCHQALLLETGRSIAYGNSKEVVSHYRQQTNGEETNSYGLPKNQKKRLLLSLRGGGGQRNCPTPSEYHWVRSGWENRSGIGSAQIKKVQFLDRQGEEVTTIHSGDLLKVKVEYEVKELIEDPHFGVAIFRDDGVYCFGPNTRFDGIRITRLKPKEGWFQLIYCSVPFLAGRFSISAAIWEREETFAYDHHKALYPLKILETLPEYGVTTIPHQWKLGGVDVKSQGNLMVGQRTFQRGVEEKIGQWLCHSLRRQAHGDIHLDSVQITHLKGERGTFCTGETLLLKGIYKTHQPVDQVGIWFGIFREDGILCYGTSSLIDGILFELNPGWTTWEIQFPRIPLLRGRFRIAIAWGDLYQNHWGMVPEACWFEMKEVLPHHGLISLKREWKGTALPGAGWIGKSYDL